MQTASELIQAQNDKLIRAGRYEKLLNEQVTYRASVANLEAEAPRYDMTAIKQIRDLALSMSPTILTRGVSGLGFHIPEHMVARDVIQMVANSAIRDTERREAERVEKLDGARKQLANVEEALKEFDGE